MPSERTKNPVVTLFAAAGTASSGWSKTKIEITSPAPILYSPAVCIGKLVGMAAGCLDPKDEIFSAVRRTISMFSIALCALCALCVTGNFIDASEHAAKKNDANSNRPKDLSIFFRSLIFKSLRCYQKFFRDDVETCVKCFLGMRYFRHNTDDDKAVKYFKNSFIFKSFIMNRRFFNFVTLYQQI